MGKVHCARLGEAECECATMVNGFCKDVNTPNADDAEGRKSEFFESLTSTKLFSEPKGFKYGTGLTVEMGNIGCSSALESSVRINVLVLDVGMVA